MRLSVRFLALSLIAVLAATAGCDSGGANDPEPEPDPAPGSDPAPVVSTVEPTSGRAGTEVTVTGEHFSETASENTVAFNGTEADVTSASATELVATVPQGADSGPVEVTVGGQSHAGPDFTYIQPEVSSVDPTSGPYDEEVSITGEHFSETAPDNIVTFNGVEATVTQASATELIAEVPKGAGSGPVAVEVAGDQATGADFTYVFTYTVSTYADGTVDRPRRAALGPDDNIFVATDDHVIHKVKPDGTVSTFAGQGTPGPIDGDDPYFRYPKGLAVDAAGNVYVADEQNHAIRKITPDGGTVTTLAGNGEPGFKDDMGGDAQFEYPTGLAIGEEGTLYVADRGNDRIRTIDSDGAVTTLAGSGTQGDRDGSGAGAQFNNPTDLAVDANGTVYVADSDNDRIRTVSPSGEVSTLAGSTAGHADGTGTDAQFDEPTDVALDANGNLYVADARNEVIRKVTLEGTVTTVAGEPGRDGSTDGEGADARFANPIGVTIGADGHLYVIDNENHALRKVTIE